MDLTFVETTVFTARWQKRLDDASLRKLQLALLANPNAGTPITGRGLLRKLRFGDPGRGKGKRGGVRVIYLHTPEAACVDLITVYGKNEKDDLSKNELTSFCNFAKSRRSQLLVAFSRKKEG